MDIQGNNEDIPHIREFVFLKLGSGGRIYLVAFYSYSAPPTQHQSNYYAVDSHDDGAGAEEMNLKSGTQHWIR